MAFHRFNKHPFIKRTSAFASLECRFGAFLIDTCLLVFIQTFVNYFLVGYPAGYTAEPGFSLSQTIQVFTDLQFISRLVQTNLYLIIFHWLYYALMESSPFQGTIGKLVLGMKVTDVEGENINFFQATIRYFGKFLSIALLFGGFLVALFNYRHQTLHDLISQCTVRVKNLPFYINNLKDHPLHAKQ